MRIPSAVGPGVGGGSSATHVARLAVWIFLFGVPLVWQWVPLNPHDHARLAQIGLGLVCALALWIGARREPPPWPWPRLALLTGLLLLGGLSAASAASPTHAWREVAIWLGWITVVGVVAEGRRASDQRLAMLAIVATGASYAVLVWLLWVTSLLSGWVTMAPDLFFGYANHRLFSHVQTVLLPMLVMVAVSQPINSALARWAIVAAVLGFSLLALGAGRATGLGIVAGAVAVLLLFGRRSWRFLAALALTAALGGSLYALMVIGWPMLTGASALTSLSLASDGVGSLDQRLYVWQLAWQQFIAHPWLGVGPMHFAHSVNPYGAHPHNAYLQLAAEWGGLFALGVLALVSWGAWRLARTVQAAGDAEAPIGIGLVAACVAVAVDAAFSGNLVMPMSQVAVALLIGFSVAWVRRQGMPGHRSATIRLPALLTSLMAVGLLAAQLWLVWSVRDEATRLYEHIETTREEIVRNPRDNPRFWSHGWF